MEPAVIQLKEMVASSDNIVFFGGAGVSTASGSTGADASGIAAAGFASGRAANGAANAKRPSTTARRNVFLKGQTLLAICGARLYNKDIPRGLSQYTRGPPLL